MLVQTQGIVLGALRYGDNKLIARIYTKEKGLLSFIVSRSKSKKNNTPANILQPLAIVELTFKHEKGTKLNYLKELSLSHPYTNLYTAIVKASMAQFIAEVLSKIVREEEYNNQELYSFLLNSLCYFDLMTEHYNNFHLYFLAELTKYLGFYPQLHYDEEEYCYFEMKEGMFTNVLSSFTTDKSKSKMLHLLLNQTVQSLPIYKINYVERKILLQLLLLYYQLHLTNFDSVKSIEVLEQVLQ